MVKINKIKKFNESVSDEDIHLTFSLAKLYKECKGNNPDFLDQINKAFNNRIIKGVWGGIQHEIVFKECYLRLTLKGDGNIATNLYVIDNKDDHHLMPVDDKINVYKKSSIITKEDPFGEENWDD